MKILFMCVANSVRSQIAEGLARKIWGSEVEIESAGSFPSKVNPYVIKVLEEVGIDASDHYSKSVEDLSREFILNIDYVITLCAEEVCPTIISKAKKIHWPQSDPATIFGSEVEKLKRFRAVRDNIQKKLEQFKEEILG